MIHYYLSLKGGVMHTLSMTLTALFLLVAAPLFSVEYGGEKSFLLETPYKVCVIPPQVDEAKAKGIKVVSVKEAKALYDQEARFFDARDKRHYDKAHIKGAFLVQFDQSKANYLAVELPKAKDEPVVFYCYGESCANSYEAALAVREQGYTNVYWLLNGFGDWQEHHYPVTHGE
jgi:rhodanese-related sulfurtransferase